MMASRAAPNQAACPFGKSVIASVASASASAFSPRQLRASAWRTAQKTELGARRAAGDAPLGARERPFEVVAFQGLLRRAGVPGQSAGARAAALEMLGQRHGIALAHALEPIAGQHVAELLVVVGEHRVGAVAQERVPERELLFARKSAGGALATPAPAR